MAPRIETRPETKLAGVHSTMSLMHNTTRTLWQSFMQCRKTIPNAAGNDLYSVQFYAPDYFTAFNAGNVFEKWATAPVTDFNQVPEGMEALLLPGGTYAVFLHKGGPAAGVQTFQYIFGTWLPGSDFILDVNRPHFEILGDKYRNDDPESEEEIWIPVLPKS